MHLPGSDGGSVSEAVVSSNDPRACELLLRELASGQTIDDATPGSEEVHCIAVGMQGATGLISSGSNWPASVGAGGVIGAVPRGDGWGSLGLGWVQGAAVLSIGRQESTGGLFQVWSSLESSVLTPWRQSLRGTLGVYPCDGTLEHALGAAELLCTTPAGAIGGPVSMSVHLPGLSWLDTASVVVEDRE